MSARRASAVKTVNINQEYGPPAALMGCETNDEWTLESAYDQRQLFASRHHANIFR